MTVHRDHRNSFARPPSLRPRQDRRSAPSGTVCRPISFFRSDLLSSICVLLTTCLPIPSSPWLPALSLFCSGLFDAETQRRSRRAGSVARERRSLSRRTVDRFILTQKFGRPDPDGLLPGFLPYFSISHSTCFAVPRQGTAKKKYLRNEPISNSRFTKQSANLWIWRNGKGGYCGK